MPENPFCSWHGCNGWRREKARPRADGVWWKERERIFSIRVHFLGMPGEDVIRSYLSGRGTLFLICWEKSKMTWSLHLGGHVPVRDLMLISAALGRLHWLLLELAASVFINLKIPVGLAEGPFLHRSLMLISPYNIFNAFQSGVLLQHSNYTMVYSIYWHLFRS